MVYRGEDLDLRTPQAGAVPPPDLAGATDLSSPQNGKRGTYRSGPILVDDVVLACCNQAFDLAVAHRAAEVRVEHLLNSMTRIEAAAVVLEARGVRIASLRRETATILASEATIVSGNGPTSPRRSDELADLLRLSAGVAARRNTAAGVEDILQVLLDARSEFPASELLLRNTSRSGLREVPEPLPPLTRSGLDQRYGQGAGLRHASDFGRSYRGDFSGSPTDVIQNSRIEALEEMVRALSQDFSNERHIVASLVRDLSRDTRAHQDDQGRSQSVLLDRIGTLEDAMLEARGANPNGSLVSKLESIEQALELRLQEMSQSWTVLSKRLQDLEVSVRERFSTGSGPTLEDISEAIDLKPIASRLDIIEEAVLGGEHRSSGDLNERLGKLEIEIARVLSTATDGGRLETVLARLEGVDGISDKLDERHGQIAQATAALSERLAAVEGAITAEIETAAAKHQAYAHDLTEVHDALMKLNQNQHTLAGSMDQWRTDFADDVAGIMGRLTTLDRDNERPLETLNALNAHMDSMNRLIIERYHRRHRFWYWLFGTDDWIGSSWPSQQAAIEAERQRVKEASDSPV